MSDNAVITLRAPSGALTAGETTTPVPTGGFREGVILLICNITTGALDEVDFFLQTTYDGVNWHDILNIHYDQNIAGVDYLRLCKLGTHVTPQEDTTAAAAPVTSTDGSMADDAENKLPIGGAMRWKMVITNAPGSTVVWESKGFVRG